ncbi:MAG: hypothetical protein FJZ47_21115, partial [Candidatus Tectomicrobia bacterium]|nr:hypothetical protein [Candidatus Tectomicrobia bacterium]
RVAQLTLAHNPQRTAWWLAQIPAAHTVTELAAHLDAPDEHAWYALWVLRDPEALPSLIAVLRHGTLRAQAKAAHLLEELKDPRAIPALRGALTDLSPHLQQRAASALRAIDVWESYYFPLTEASYGTYLRARLDWLVSEVQQHAGPLVPLVQPGLSGEAITAHLRPVSGHVSQEVQALYRWQNGESLPHEGTLMPWHRWLPLERAAQVYHQACQRRGPDSPWHATWWPLWVAADGPQAYFVISQPDPHALSPIYTLGTPKYRPALWLAYDSLTTMLTTLAACYAAGAYWLAWTWGSEEPYIDHDPQQVAALTRAYNPVWTAWWLAYTPGTEAQPAHLATLAPAQPPGPPREVFARAVHAFHPWPTPHTVPALLQALRAPEAVARRYAATLLGLLGDHHAVLPLMRALQDGDHLVRWQAAEALGRLGDGRAVPALLQSLVEDRRVATDVAAITLGATDVREAAAQALGLLGDPRAIPALLQGVEVAAVPQVYIQALGTLRASAALPPLLRLLRHPQADVRGTTAQALAQLGHPQAVKPLGYALADPIPMVRWRAAQALGRLGDPRAVGPLAQAAQDPMPLVREAAQYARHRLQQHA